MQEPTQQENFRNGEEPVATNRFFYGYLMVALSFVIQAVGWGIHNSYGVFLMPLVKEFGWTRAIVAGAGSVSVIVNGAGSIFNGGMNDRVGPRIIMTGCGLLMGAGYMLMSGIDSIWEIYLFYGLIVGMGVSGTDVVLLSTVARWFHVKRGIMSGVIKVGTGLGMVIVPLFITLLIRTFSWRTCFFILGVIILATYVTLAQFLVRDPALRKQHPDNLLPLESTGTTRREGGVSFRHALTTRQFWSLCLITGLVGSCTYTVMFHIIPHLIDLGIPPVKAATVLSTVGGVSIIGRLIMGATADRIGSKKAMMISFALLFAGLCLLSWAKTLWMFYIFAVIHGFAHGGFYTLMSPTVAEFFGTRSHGVIFGAVLFSATIGGAIGPFGAGHLFDVTNTYRVVFLILAGTGMAAVMLTATLTPVTKRR
jgi:MFS family permease